MSTELRNEQASGEGHFRNGDAIFALATVPGKSAVAVFRCSGPTVWQLFANAFSRYGALERAESHSAVYGFLLYPDSSEKDALVDEVLLLKFCAPRSYSGEDMLEIHCHGSLAVLDAVRKLLRKLGLREARRGEFTYRSIKYGKRNLHQAEAIALLAESRSQNQRRSALYHLDQPHNPFTQRLQQMRSDLLQILARSELQLDYDETELEFHYQLPDSLPSARSHLQYLRDCLSSYRLQKNCWKTCKIVLIGAVNSGKSSLFNRLLAQERSIVSEQAGTTRDYLEAHFELAGQSILLYDTAGLRRDSDDPIEQQGMLRSRQLLEQADFVLLLSDIRVALVDLTRRWPDIRAAHEHSAKEWQDGYAEADNPTADLTVTETETEITMDAAVAELQRYRSEMRQIAAKRKLPLLEIWNKSDLLSSPNLPPLPNQTHVNQTSDNKDQTDTKAISEQLQDEWQKQRAAENEAGTECCLFLCSAKTGQGLPQLIDELQRSLPVQLKAETEAPLSERQAELIHQTAELLQEYCDGLQNREQQLFDMDWGSELLRQICGRLGEVNGQTFNAEMLRDIFQQFCVGK
ncbi:50S ribosome-binding GTPase [Candidatus Haliotispira prima]|uniref:tRNA modification GTPase MnmE n=1 Tax=Candidatus Haliotispira prima TaxID=3034016 RepID=A0ABY8MHL7_9SPIO|nr:50S ribosome-binding GTPase [Candidatus Haliotispira prima]